MSNKDNLKPRSSNYRADRSEEKWQERGRVRDPDERAKLDKEAKKEEDADCQAPGCRKEAVHHDKRENRSGRCIEHWEGDSDDNG